MSRRACWRPWRRKALQRPRRRLADYLIALEAAAYFAASQIALALPPGLLLARAVQTGLAPRPVLAGKQASAERLGRIAGAVARRWPGEALCLQRSLVLLWLLRRRRVDATLRVGVRRVESGLIAHAWVESNGQPLNDLPSHCAEFDVLEGAASTVGALRRAELVS